MPQGKTVSSGFKMVSSKNKERTQKSKETKEEDMVRNKYGSECLVSLPGMTSQNIQL